MNKLFKNVSQEFLSFAIYTLGCKANTYDSECMKASMISENYRERDFLDKCDIYIINTCAVTNKSSAKSRKMIRKASKLNSKSLICVVGCYSQIESSVIAKLPNVKIILGTEKKYQIGTIITNYLNKHPFSSLSDVNDIILEVNEILGKGKHEKNNVLTSFTNNTRAFVKIQDGCNNFCTFCIIPYTRGKLRSREPKEIIKEINLLCESGHKEVVLTGIHTAGYGEDLKHYNFFNLLHQIYHNCPLLKRLRISSIEISQISNEILQLLQEHSNFFVPHLHVPLQSGSDNILKLMERKYSKKQYSDIIKLLKNKIKNLAITTDVIVGFPQETNENFEECFAFCKKINFSKIHVFPYSKRDGTPAVDMKQVNEFVKRMRVARLLDLSDQMRLQFIKLQKNRNLNVLFETKMENDYYCGYSENYIKIKVQSEKNLINLIKKVQIIKENLPISEGRLVENELT